MKTINPDISIFRDIKRAKKYFDKQICADLLEYNGLYLVDRAKTAIKEWPKLYKLIKEK